jgi:signal transduction histidine kinase
MKFEISVARKVAIAFLAALGISLGLGLFSYHVTTRFMESADTVARTHRTMSLMQALLASTVSAESEARGYVITGNEEFLDLYRTATRDTQSSLEELRAMVRDSVVRDRLSELEALTAERLERLALTVETRRLKGFEAVREISGPGKQLMDDVRMVATEIEERQTELLDERAAYAATLSRRTIWAVIASAVVAAIVAAASVVILTADVAHRERMEKEVLDISEREQRRIGQDLHDGLCQQLTGISLLSRSIQQRLNGEIGEDAGRITRLINDCIDQTRRVTRGLHPVPDEPSGLQVALQELAESVSANAGVSCRLECPEPVPIPDQNAATNLYRIAQEAVQNALRHAEASLIVIRLSADEDAVTLSVSDDGRGFPDRPEGRGLGLQIMDYRAHTLAADVAIQPREPRGTEVTCTMPRSSLS